MEHKALAALMVRLLGLAQLVIALNGLASVVPPFFSPEYVEKVGRWTLLGVALFSVGVPFALGLILIYFPKTVASHALRVEGIEPKRPDDATLLERVAVSGVGVWFGVKALIDGAYYLSHWRLYRRFFGIDYPSTSAPAIGPDDFAGLLAAALQLILGVALILGSKGLVATFTRMRG